MVERELGSELGRRSLWTWTVAKATAKLELTAALKLTVSCSVLTGSPCLINMAQESGSGAQEGLYQDVCSCQGEATGIRAGAQGRQNDEQVSSSALEVHDFSVDWSLVASRT